MTGGTPFGAAQTAPVAAKAAAIDAAQGHPLTWKTIIKRALAVAVARTSRRWPRARPAARPWNRTRT